MERIDIIGFLRNEKEDLKKKFGVISIGLFGSFAKGNQQHESDIDLLVELSEPSFDSLAGLQLHLEKKLGKSVDLVRKRKGLSDRFLKRIERDIQYA
ncbi:putative toxin-antitoxin system, toxin component [delta proteobacterium NaphS2]|nr:putative toxin-antitoxin system, toxin component [delta proteobacterium NaphS2]